MNNMIVIDKILNLYLDTYEDIFHFHKHNNILTTNKDCTQWSTIKIHCYYSDSSYDKIGKVTNIEKINPLDYITLSKLGRIKKVTPIYIVSFREIDFKH